MIVHRINTDCYLVGAVYICRYSEATTRGNADEIERTDPTTWRAITSGGHVLFGRDTLDEILDMAAGAIELLRPA